MREQKALRPGAPRNGRLPVHPEPRITVRLGRARDRLHEAFGELLAAQADLTGLEGTTGIVNRRLASDWCLFLTCGLSDAMTVVQAIDQCNRKALNLISDHEKDAAFRRAAAGVTP